MNPRHSSTSAESSVEPAETYRRGGPSSGGARKIYLVTHEFAPFFGGVATYVQEIARAAVKIGYDVEVITVDYRGRQEFAGILSADHELPFPVRRLPSSGRLTPGGIASLAAGLRRMRADLAGAPVVWLSAGAHMAAMLLESSGVLRVPHAVSFFHGSEIFKFTRHLPWRLLSRRFFRRKAHFGAASHYVQEIFRQSHFCPAGASCFLARCACPSLFESSGFDPSRRVPGISAESGPLVVLTVARLHPRKGQLDLAHAFSRLPVEFRTRLVYRLVGTGDEGYLAEVAQACAASGVRLEAAGPAHPSKLPGFYDGCDVYAQTSRTLQDSVEGFGISYLEASSCGKPIVAYDTGGVNEAVLSDVTGLLVSEGDIDGLAMQLGRLLGDPLLCARLGSQGRKFAASFRWEDSARILCGTALEAVHAHT